MFLPSRRLPRVTRARGAAARGGGYIDGARAERRGSTSSSAVRARARVPCSAAGWDSESDGQGVAPRTARDDAIPQPS